METRPNQHADDSVHAHDSNVTVLRLSEDVKWLFPVLIAVGFNIALSVFLIFEWRDAGTNYALTYNRLTRMNAWMEAHGVNTEQFGPMPSPP
jgi:hypothetical protein